MRTLNLGIALVIAASATSCAEPGVYDDTCFFAIGRYTAEFVDGERCTSVVRVDYHTLEPIAAHTVCGPLALMDEATARSQAQADTGFGDDTQQIAEAGSGLYIFYDDPVDFGGVAFINAETGSTVFGGGIIWSGTGQITYPLSWLEDPVSGCDTGAPPTGSEITLEMRTPVDARTVRRVIDAAWTTPISTAINGHGELHSTHVVRYARGAGFIDESDEWLVIFVSGP